LTLPVQDDVNGQPFLLRLEASQATAERAVLLPYSVGAPGELDLWLDGALLSGGHLSLQLGYNPVFILKDLARQATTFGLRSLWLLLLSALFYLLPGGALVVWLLREGDWIERTVVALGMSVAVYALLVYATMTGLRLGQAATYGFLAVCAGLIALRWWLDGRRLPALREMWAGLRADPAPLALAVVVALVVGVRVWATRDMVAPRWGDSYHHTVISQLLVDNGGLFDSWAPYAPYTGLTTHFGFHANVALFHWMSGEPVIQSVIWIGQIMNVLAVLVLYPLGNRIGGRWAGTIAVLIAGLWSTTPMMYVNWGRYPQLTGQVLLPVAAWLLWQAMESQALNWRLIASSAVASLGQVLAYYRMPFYFVLLMGPILLSVYATHRSLRWRQWWKPLLPLVVTGALVAVTGLPWVFRMTQGLLGPKVAAGVSSGMDLAGAWDQLLLWKTIGEYVPPALLWLAGIGLLGALVRRNSAALAVAVWGAGLVLTLALRLLGLPGAAFLDAFASMIFAYAPVALLGGWLIASLVEGSRRRWQGTGLLAVGAVALAAFGGSYTASQVPSDQYELVTPADLRAMDWIATHTAPDARFLVNGFLIYGGRSIVGSDAGWWLSLLTGRASTMPPQYALLTETEAEPGYGQRMVDLVAGLRQTPLTSPEGLALVCGEEITHVYVGVGEGRVAIPPSEPLFTAEEMLASSAFDAVYHQDGVWVFALTEEACSP
jgi:hypothetical protein